MKIYENTIEVLNLLSLSKHSYSLFNFSMANNAVLMLMSQCLSDSDQLDNPFYLYHLDHFDNPRTVLVLIVSPTRVALAICEVYDRSRSQPKIFEKAQIIKTNLI